MKYQCYLGNFNLNNRDGVAFNLPFRMIKYCLLHRLKCHTDSSDSARFFGNWCFWIEFSLTFAKEIPFDNHIVKEQYRWQKKKKNENVMIKHYNKSNSHIPSVSDSFQASICHETSKSRKIVLKARSRWLRKSNLKRKSAPLIAALREPERFPGGAMRRVRRRAVQWPIVKMVSTLRSDQAVCFDLPWRAIAGKHWQSAATGNLCWKDASAWCHRRFAARQRRNNRGPARWQGGRWHQVLRGQRGRLHWWWLHGEWLESSFYIRL